MLLLVVALTGCQSYVESTPSELHEGDHAANYSRVFREDAPADVTVVNSVVVTYSSRPGVVTTDDFELELLLPDARVTKTSKRFYLRKSEASVPLFDVESRKKNARPWYAPKPLDQYDAYRDATSVGYVHMLVQKEIEPDGRRRVFISKH